MCFRRDGKYRQSETVGNVCDCLILTTKNIKNVASDAVAGATLLLTPVFKVTAYFKLRDF